MYKGDLIYKQYCLLFWNIVLYQKATQLFFFFLESDVFIAQANNTLWVNGCPYSEKVPDEWCQPGEIEPGLSEGSPLVWNA